MAKFLIDDVHTRICDLEDPNSIFVADLFYHKNCFPDYIFKCNTAKKVCQFQISVTWSMIIIQKLIRQTTS